MSPLPSYILCIETANAVTSVAISKDGNSIALKEILEPNKAADKLHVLIDELMSVANLSYTDLNAVAISSGPGSYTGLRIAVSAAKGYCFALNIPLISISTLEAMVEGVQTRYGQQQFDIYIPMIDARRMEVFTSFYTKDKEIIRAFSSLILDDTFPELLLKGKKHILFGNGAEKSKNILEDNDVKYICDFIPSASDLCLSGYNSFLKKDFEDIAYFEPHYSKAFYSTTKKQAF